MNNKLKFFMGFVIAIIFFIFINKVLVPQNIDNRGRTIDESIQHEEKGSAEDTFAVDKHMFVEAENSFYVTSAVCVHDGKSYVLLEDEYAYLMDGGQMEEVLKQRQEVNEK